MYLRAQSVQLIVQCLTLRMYDYYLQKRPVHFNQNILAQFTDDTISQQ